MEDKELAAEFVHERTLAELYAAYRQYLNHEHNLINQRLSWNFTIQGFLFTSYAFVLNKTADVRIELSKATTGSVDTLLASLHELQVLLFVVAVAGVCVSLAIHFSAWGARRAMNELRRRWSTLKCTQEQTLEDFSLASGYPHIMGGGDPSATKLGFRAPAMLSLAFAVAWLVLIADQLLGH